MVPQNSDNNRHIWAGIEGAVRKMAKREGALYVLTGPAFIGADLRKVGKVLVPTHLYKVVYSPRQRAGAAWFVDNAATDHVQIISIAQLEAMVGIDLLPSLTAAQKQRMLRLPKVKPAKFKEHAL
jgi:endonuclease G